MPESIMLSSGVRPTIYLQATSWSFSSPLSSTSMTGGWTRRNRSRAPVPGSSSALELAQIHLCFRLDLQMPLKGTAESSLWLPEDQRGSTDTQDHPRGQGSFRSRSRGSQQDQGELGVGGLGCSPSSCLFSLPQPLLRSKSRTSKMLAWPGLHR